MTSAGIGDEAADPATVIHPAEAPTASTVRFGLLVAAVLAAATGMFFVIHGSLPNRAESLQQRVDQCDSTLSGDPAFTSPSPEQRDRYFAAMARYRACLRPALGEIAGFVTAGIGLLFGVAAMSYVVHPWWIVRRRRLRQLTATSSPALFAYLDQIRREMGVRRPPDWRVAPYSRTSGGQAFGTTWHRYVQLDAGLVVHYATDRPAFRAVVLHELAHLRNRDVDRTYLTIGIWRAFLVVAVLPYAVLLLHPMLFRTPLDWQWNALFFASPVRSAYRVGALLAMAGLVYLTRNAVLRVRESHADAVAAGLDGPGSALPAVLGRLPTPRRWWSRWGTHPHPAQRLDTVRNPRLLLRAGLWELAGAGIATGIFAANLTLMLGVVAGLDPTLGMAMIGVAAGAALAAVLAVSIWRATAAAPERRPSIRTWLVLPAVLTAGYLVGRFLSLDSYSRLVSAPSTALWRSWIVAALLLSTGAVLVAAWVASAARGILASPQRRRWAMPAVVVAAAVVGATGFVLWFPNSNIESGLGLFGSDRPASGGEIGWYAWLVAATGWQLRPVAYLVHLPLTLPALTLLWLVPVVAGLRRPPAAVAGDHVPLRRAVIPGLIGGGCTAVIGAVLPFLAKATLPASVRRLPASDAMDGSFPLVMANIAIFTGILAVVIVLTVVVARGGRHRPALAALAAMLTALLSAVAAHHVVVPMQCYANVFGLDPAPTHCPASIDVGSLAEMVGIILVQGLVVAVPFVLAAAAAGVLIRRRRPRADVPAVPLTRPGFTATVAVNVLLVVVVGVLTWGILPDFASLWLEPTFG